MTTLYRYRCSHCGLTILLPTIGRWCHRCPHPDTGQPAGPEHTLTHIGPEADT